MSASKNEDAMLKTKFDTEDYAEKFDVHPKTILRAVLNRVNPSDWKPEPLTIDRVAKGFKMKPDVLFKVMKGREHLKDAEQAAAIMGISIRRFHQRRVEKGSTLKPAASHGRTVRYALTDIAAHNDL